MHTGALYLTKHHSQPITACSLLHKYRTAVFLASFSLTLIGIMVSSRARHEDAKSQGFLLLLLLSL